MDNLVQIIQLLIVFIPVNLSKLLCFTARGPQLFGKKVVGILQLLLEIVVVCHQHGLCATLSETTIVFVKMGWDNFVGDADQDYPPDYFATRIGIGLSVGGP